MTSVTFSGGFAIRALPATASSTVTVVATLPGGPAGIAVERGAGRVYVWGDEWVTFDSQWSTMPEIGIFWQNVLGWLTFFR